MKPFYIVVANGHAQPKQFETFSAAEIDAHTQLQRNPNSVYFVMEAKLMLRFSPQPVERLEIVSPK